MPYSPKSIANFFLDLASKQGDSITPMKLQKLVYYAHGWYAGYTNQPLINESVEAWQYGPVIESLYREFKRFGSGVITDKATDWDWESESRFSVVPVPTEPKILSFLENIWKSYSQYTAIKLSDMTHAKGGPWDATWSSNAGIKGLDIPFDLIAKHFRVAVEKSKKLATA